MSGASVRVLCALLGVLVAVTSLLALSCVDFQANTPWSPCPGMTSIKDIHLDQVTGRWFLHERVLPSSEPDQDGPVVKRMCMVMTPHRTTRGFEMTGDSYGEDSWQNNITYVIQDPVSNPGLWDETKTNADGTETTVARSQLTHQETDYLVFALCPANTVYACNQLGEIPTFLVWGSNATADSLDLGPINDRIIQSGIDYIEVVKMDTSACDGYEQT